MGEALILPWRGIYPKVTPSAYIAPTVCLVGDLEIGDQSSVWFGCVLRADVNIIRIGARTNIQDGTVVHVSSTLQGTFIGDDVTIGHMALIHACTIGDGAFIGMKACVMDGAVVEPGAMVAAGALVPPGKRVLSGELWAGSPARMMRSLTDQDREMLRISADRYVALGQEYLAAARSRT